MAEKLKVNVKPILGSLMVALILWFMVASEKIYSYQIKVPIEILRLAPGKTLLEKIPEYAIIEVQGKGRSLIGAWFYDVRFRLEFPNIKKSQNIKLGDYRNFLDLPATFGINIVEFIEPVDFELKVDDQISVELPVELKSQINTEDGYVLSNYLIDNDSARITGPKSKISHMMYIETENLNRSEQKLSFSERLNLYNPEPGILNISPTSVNIDFDIQRLVERIVYKIPISIQNVPRHLEVKAIPPDLALKVKGGEKIVAALKPDEFKAQIDFASNYHPDREKYAASISTPEEVSWLESIPTTFSLQVKRK
jgi:YbbR domain-containing protein